MSHLVGGGRMVLGDICKSILLEGVRGSVEMAFVAAIHMSGTICILHKATVIPLVKTLNIYLQNCLSNRKTGFCVAEIKLILR